LANAQSKEANAFFRRFIYIIAVALCRRSFQAQELRLLGRFALIARAENLERAAQALVDDKHGAGVVELVAVVRRREHGHELAVREELVPVRHDLVRAADEVQVVRAQELIHHIRPEDVGHTTVALGPALRVCVRVGPQQVAQQAFVGHVGRSPDVTNLIERVQVWREATMRAEDLAATSLRQNRQSWGIESTVRASPCRRRRQQRACS